MGSGAWDNKGTDISGNGAVDWAEYKRGTPLNGDIIMVFTSAANRSIGSTTGCTITEKGLLLVESAY